MIIYKMNNIFAKKKMLVVAPVVLVMVLDLVFTMAGQPAQYWQDPTFFDEGSPLGQIIMPFGPAAFILFFIFYLIFAILLLSFLPRPLNIMAGIGLFLGHAWGSASWLGGNWYLIISYFVLLAIISGFCINKWLTSMLDVERLTNIPWKK